MINLENVLQIPSFDQWDIWLIMGGRGLGKTTSAAFHIANLLKSQQIKSVAFIGRTVVDIINTMMYNGIMKFLPNYKINQSIKILKNEENDRVGYFFSEKSPHLIRGFSFDFVWIDEFGSFSHKNIYTLWNNLLLCLRIGISKIIITTTPSSLSLIKTIISDYKTYLTTGSSYENENLSNFFTNHIHSMKKDEFYKEEILGEMFNNYTLWNPNDIVYRNLEHKKPMYSLGIDPAMTCGTTGIVLSAICDSVAYVVEDYSQSSPIKQWTQKVLEISKLYENLQIILEINQGGQALKDILQMSGVTSTIITQHTRESKYQRNLKSYWLYDQKRVFHIKKLEHLEKEMLNHTKDRVDALTWSLWPLYNQSGTFEISIL